ncbi:sodium-dependent dopamine transporter-like [Diadema antillarum]|uniref:sodium-dependent dopamine transporter-like n=1 Tax=Diadema antillarum TaxID=105358 RepID=UPI003A88C89D
MDNAVAPGGAMQDKVYAFNMNPVGAAQGKLMEVTMDAGSEVAGRDRGNSGNRETWGGKIDFLLSVIGFCVDLANVWRFPYMCYKNGGGAFLIPYIFMLIFMGIPLFYMELALGQFNQTGPVTVWDKICPLFKGVGFAMICIAFFVDFYYNVIISYSIYYLFASFNRVLPWSTCDNSWNTIYCFRPADGPTYYYNYTTEIDGINTTFVINKTKSAATEYYERAVLQMHESPGIHDLGKVVWQLALCLLAVYIICYFSLWKGIKGSGKVVWITATLPYMVLFCLLIRGVTLPGAGEGIKYYLIPKWELLRSPQVWVDAAAQICFSLGPGFGVLLAFASYNRFHNNIYKDALLTSCINCMTSFLAGFVVFAVLGYMAVRNGQSVDEVATEGPGLVFVTYPEALATMPGSNVWSILFFLMLLTLGLDSSFGGSEAILTGLSDQFPRAVKKHREVFIAILFAVYYLVGLSFVSQGGTYLVNLFDNCVAYYAILFTVVFETIGVAWLYGLTIPTKRISEDINQMLGWRPGYYWRFCWMFLSPVMIVFIMGFGLANERSLRLDKYIYPEWSVAVGWLITCTSIAMIPITAIYQMVSTPGSLTDRLMKNLYTQKQWPNGYDNNMYTAEQESRMNGMVLEAKPVTPV